MNDTTRHPTYLVIDTETTGLFDFSLPADDPSQPRLAAVSFIVSDESGKAVSARRSFIRPDGWTMSEEAGRVNGLTDEFLAENGIEVAEVLDDYCALISEGLIVVAFNAQFDCKVMRAELRRAGREDLFDRTPNICTMRALAAYKEDGLKIKGGGYVKLSEACAIFGITQYQAHDALSDAENARAILEILIRDGRLPEAKVHYSKTKVA